MRQNGCVSNHIRHKLLFKADVLKHDFRGFKQVKLLKIKQIWCGRMETYERVRFKFEAIITINVVRTYSVDLFPNLFKNSMLQTLKCFVGLCRDGELQVSYRLNIIFWSC